MAYRPPPTEKQRIAGIDIELLFIDFYQMGTYENFYSSLKKYLKS
jgi:hypothetical protein